MLSFALVIFSSCAKTDTTVSSPASTSSIIVQSNWRVTYFSDNGTDHTSDYDGFTFLFNAGGSVAAYNPLLSVNGTWSSYNDDSRDNLLLNFPNTLAVIAALNHDWHIIEKTNTKLRMQSLSGGPGVTSYLTLEKN
jgi:hypothetical protein